MPRLHDERLAALALIAGIAAAVVASCGGDETTPNAAASNVASSASSPGVGGSGGSGGGGGGPATDGHGGAGGCMVAVGGCYDAFDCTPWASCECPDLPCSADCMAYRQCESACADHACVDDCVAQHPTGADEDAAILSCAHCGADPCFGSLCKDAYPPIACP